MHKFSMKCSCGDTMVMDAETREEAVGKFKAMMTQEAINAHMAEKHPADHAMSMADCHAMIEKDVMQVADTAAPMA